MSQTILEKICEKKKVEVAEHKAKTSEEQLRQLASQWTIIPVMDRLRKEPRTAIMAEIKRASPSKGDIAPGIVADEVAVSYAKAGAAVISCLTEQYWFKGNLQDLLSVRKAINDLPNRPALLRKDFIIDEYQIIEAKAYGADTLLLIVAALTLPQLTQLLHKTREEGMEPLVEVNSREEFTTALELGAKFIGVNNRNLHTFHVDMNTSGDVVRDKKLPDDVILAALSGMSTRDDVIQMESVGAQAVLVGEALMRADNVTKKIRELQGSSTLVKICGLRDEKMAIEVAEFGADFIGLVFAPSPRTIDLATASTIISALKAWRQKKSEGKTNPSLLSSALSASALPADYFQYGSSQLIKTLRKQHAPLVVGVFADQDPEEVNRIAEQADLDVVQFSGYETPEQVRQCKRPFIKAIHVGEQSDEELLASIKSYLPSSPSASYPLLAILLDTKSSDPNVRGGTGKAFNWAIAHRLCTQHRVPFFLAGGLSPENVGDAVDLMTPFAVDVSSGVETNGTKDIKKISSFIKETKSK